MPRRRRLDINQASGVLTWLTGLPVPVSKTALQVATHAHKQKTDHYGNLGTPQLVNYKEQGPRRKPKRHYGRTKRLKGTPVNLSLRGGKLKTTTFFNKNKILPTSTMPYRKYSRKPRRFKKRRGGRRRRLSNLWPPTQVVKLRLVHTVAYAGTGGAIGTNFIKANSLNDPTGGASAQLPLGVDQWANLYQKYKVIGSKMTLRAHPSTITGSAMIGIHLNNSTTPPATDHDHYRELPHTTMRMLSPDIDLCKLSMTYSPKKYPLGIKQVKDADDIEGTFSTTPGDPTDVVYWHVFVQDANKTDNVTFEIQMVIDYICLLYDPVRPARSAL